MGYTSRELAGKLEINYQKWKRHAREFLPPDQKARLQSGYTREFTRKEAFEVFLGGCLVSSCGFSIPEARKVLKGLNKWLKKKGLYPGSRKNPSPQDAHVRSWSIKAQRYSKLYSEQEGFGFTAVGFVRREITEINGFDFMTETFAEEHFPTNEELGERILEGDPKVIPITRILEDFNEAIR